jgi:DNA-binding beta-propeller fold protein YncE
MERGMGDFGPRQRQEREYRSPFDLAFSPDGRKLAVTDRTAGCLYVLDADSGDLRTTIPLRGRPSGLAWESPERVLVCEYDAGSVAKIDTETGQVLRRFFLGPKPVGAAVAKNKGLLVVCDFGLQTVSIVDIETGAMRASTPAGKHPHSVAITPDERMAVIANMLPSGSAAEHTSTAVVSLIDLDAGTKIADVPLPDNSANIRQVRVSPDGRWAYLVHTRGRTMLPTTQLDRGWVNTNALSIIDLSHKQVFATVLLDTVTEGAADPWGIALSPDGGTAWISVAGAQQIARIELGRLHDLLAGRADESQISDLKSQIGDAGAIWQQIRRDPTKRDQLSYHLSALYAAGLISRVPIDVKGPRAIAMSPDAKQLVVASYFSGEVLVLNPDRCQAVKRIGLGPQPAPDMVRHGEFVFHDGRHSFQNWLSCVSCHPDGRADGFNWDLLNDGIGTPKNARSLLWSYKTPPLMSLGTRSNMEEATQKGFQFIQFREIDEGDLNAVRAYLRSMTPEPSPYLVNGVLSDKARKGRALFESPEVGCSGCHPAPLFTSLKTVDVGTRSALDRSDAFDTPTCVELWRTGPYLHDGSAVTLKDVLTTRNLGDRHGRTSHLSDEEIDALVEYLLSL